MEDLLLRDVAQIMKTSGGHVTTCEELEAIVELPLRKACIELYKKGIETLSSSANREGITRDGEVWILINYEALSEENQALARQRGVLYEDHHNNCGRMTLRLSLKVSWDTTVERVEEWAMQMANEFKDQPMDWAHTWTREDLCQIHCLDANDERYDAYYLCTALGKAYDAKSERFYASNEQMLQVRRLKPKPHFVPLGRT